MRLTDLLALSHVPRWSIVSMAQGQNVGDHTFRVLVIATELAARTGVTLSASDLLHILCHDGHESWTADVPSPLKHDIEGAGFDMLRTVPWMKALQTWSSPDAEVVFKIADRVEAFTFIQKHGVGSQAKIIVAGCGSTLWALLDRDRPSWKIPVRSVVEDIINESERGWTYQRSATD